MFLNLNFLSLFMKKELPCSSFHASKMFFSVYQGRTAHFTRAGNLEMPSNAMASSNASCSSSVMETPLIMPIKVSAKCIASNGVDHDRGGSLGNGAADAGIGKILQRVAVHFNLQRNFVAAAGIVAQFFVVGIFQIPFVVLASGFFHNERGVNIIECQDPSTSLLHRDFL